MGHHCGWRDGKMGHLTERLTEKMDLTTVQQDKLNVVSDQFQEARGSFRDQRGATRAEVLALLEADTMDREKAMALFEARRQEMESRARIIIAAMADFTDSLSSEQRAQLKEMIERRGGWHH
jgi:Spy/CpxP family protein refolding chaperone